MDANDRLGNYFRKKLNESSTPSDGWDKPSPALKADVLARLDDIPPVASEKKNLKTALFLGALLVLLLASNGIWYKHSLQTLADKEEALSAAEESGSALEVATAELAEVKAQSAAILAEKEVEIEALLRERRKSESVNANLTQDLRRAKKTNASMKAEISGLEEKLQASEDQWATLNATESETASRSFADIVAPLPALTARVEKSSTELPVRPIPSEVGVASMQSAASFQLGYRLGRQQMTMPVHRNFKFQRILGSKTAASTVRSTSQGLYLAYFLSEKWSLSGGVSIARFNINQSVETELWYDKKGEYINDRGERANDFAYETTTPFAQTRGVITFRVPDRLATKDVLKLTLADAYDIQLIQIPMAAEYHMRQNKWDWILQGGLHWSRINFKDYTFTSILQFEGENIAKPQSRVISKDIPSQKIINTFVGLGLEYSFYKHWNARLGASYGFNHYKNAGDKFLSTPRTNTNFEIIVSRKF